MNLRFTVCSVVAALIGPRTLAVEDPPSRNGTRLLSAEEVGEVTIRDVLLLSPAQRAELARVVNSDPEARALLEIRLKEARRRLDKQPRPLAVLHYEGLVNTDPRRLETVKHLEDMDDAALLLEVWQATSDTAVSEKCRQYVRAWAATYRPTGNDVNENKLQPLFTIYEAMRAGFAPQERRRIDRWLSDIAEKQIAQGKRPEARRTNRHTKRMRIVATIGLALHRLEWLDYARSGFKEFVTQNLYADGTTFDLKHRDTLTYHCSALEPLVALAVLATRNGQNLYTWTSPTGSSLKKAVDYVLPYADGSKQRREWTHSQVELDRRRAAAGLKEYQPGSLFDPKYARSLLEEASFFDLALVPLVTKLAGRKATHYPTWRMVVNEACRRTLAPTKSGEQRRVGV
jgi:hypothetical protein